MNEIPFPKIPHDPMPENISVAPPKSLFIDNRGNLRKGHHFIDIERAFIKVMAEVPCGTYRLPDVRNSIKVNIQMWRRWAKRYLFNEHSDFRLILKNIGVEMETREAFLRNDGFVIMGTTFTKTREIAFSGVN